MRLFPCLSGVLYVTALIVATYLLLAYAVLPWMWTHYEQQQGLQSHPMVTRTVQGIPGDPLNVGLVGSKDEIVHAILAAGWSPADPVLSERHWRLPAAFSSKGHTATHR